MKHIFVCHSWITQLVAESVIRSKNIPLADVIILNDSARNFNFYINDEVKACLRPFKRISEPAKGKFNLNWIKSNLLWYIKVVGFRRNINKLVGNGEYHLYVPQLYMYYYKLLSSHHKCKSFSFIEEGMLSYNTQDFINNKFPAPQRQSPWVRFMRNVDGLVKRASEKLTIDSGYSQAYKIMPFAFPGFANVVDVAPAFDGLVKESGFGEPIDNIMILGNYQTDGKFKKVSLSGYLDGFKNAVQYVLADTGGDIYFKHHPSVPKTTESKLDEIMADLGKGRFKKFDEDTCTEFILAKYKPNTYTFNCSLAVYAKVFNCKLIVLSKFVKSDTDIMNFGGIDLGEYYIDPVLAK